MAFTVFIFAEYFINVQLAKKLSELDYTKGPFGDLGLGSAVLYSPRLEVFRAWQKLQV